MRAYKGVEALPRTLELVCKSCEAGLPCETETPCAPNTEHASRHCCELRFVEQTLLPRELVVSIARTSDEVIAELGRLALRGAPALGVAGACAVVLYACNETKSETVQGLLAELEEVAPRIALSRPTAVNLSWGVNKVMDFARKQAHLAPTLCDFVQALFNEVKQMEAEDELTNRKLGEIGAKLIPENCRVLTHCNAGSLATVFFGTALGVVYTAAQQGKIERVFVDETRPLGQGARLTVWELAHAGIPTTLLCDNVAAVLMKKGMVDLVLVGADRVCKNGDVANKIGSYALALLAHYHNIPFYVAAPFSTFDGQCLSGDAIVIEQRPASEVVSVVPNGVDVLNPAFDVIPAEFITAIITEKGIFEPKE